MTQFLHFLLALAVILGLAWLASYDRQKIRVRYIIQLIIIEIALAFFFCMPKAGCG
jgi:CNT family concentrative nucleoside transporter